MKDKPKQLTLPLEDTPPVKETEKRRQLKPMKCGYCGKTHLGFKCP